MLVLLNKHCNLKLTKFIAKLVECNHSSQYHFDKIKPIEVTSTNLNQKISQLRNDNNWSQEELAEKLNVSRQSVSKWESGQAKPDLDKIIALSNIFDVSTDYLLKDDNEEKSNKSTNKHHFSLSWIQFGRLNSAIWAIAGAIYFICGFAFDNWDSSMIIFSITLILTIIIRLFAH